MISREGAVEARLVADRDRAVADETLSLIGLDHPLVAAYIDAYRAAPADALGISAKSRDGKSGAVALWQVVATNEKRHQVAKVIALAVDSTGHRQPAMEKLLDEMFQTEPTSAVLSRDQASSLLVDAVEPMLHRDLIHRGFVREGQAYEASLVGWIELA